MNKPIEQEDTITPELPNEQLKVNELAAEELNAVTGGVGKTLSGGKASSGIVAMDEAPKETVTFEYGGLLINYALQSPD
jgi:hypothetical protein